MVGRAALEPATQDGYLAIFTTAEAGIYLPQSPRTPDRIAIISAATFQHKPISTSRGWALPKDDTHDKQWERIGALSISIDEAREVVSDLGLMLILKFLDMGRCIGPEARQSSGDRTTEEVIEDKCLSLSFFCRCSFIPKSAFLDSQVGSAASPGEQWWDYEAMQDSRLFRYK